MCAVETIVVITELGCLENDPMLTEALEATSHDSDITFDSFQSLND